MKKLFLFLSLFFAVISSNAQNDLNSKGIWGLRLGSSASVYLPHTYNFAVIPYYKITPRLDTGIGLGFMCSNHLGEHQGAHCSVPMFADLKYVFLNKEISPFAETQFGLNFGLTGYKDLYYANYGSYYGSLQLGVSVRRSDISLGIMAYDYSKYGDTVDEDVECSLFLRYAYNFKLTDR